MAVNRIGIPVVVVVIALVLAAVATLAGPPLTPAPAYAQNGVCPENPDPVDPDEPAVIVESPSDGAEVTSPISVSGQAAVFEANVRLTLFDAEGNELVDTFTTAEGAGPELHPFATEIQFTLGETQQGCLRVFEESAVDGSPINVVQIELTLVVDPDVTPEPPDTGSAGLGPDISGGILVPVAMLILALTLLISSTLAATMPYQRKRR